MELYKLKHKPTGLYYQPVKGKYGSVTNLSKKGKIYQSKSNALNGTGDIIGIAVSKRQYNDNKELFDSLGVKESRYRDSYDMRCPKSDFEIEYIK